jgi:hypothetical protein
MARKKGLTFYTKERKINMIKKITFALGVIAFLSAVGIVGRFESEYTMQGTVVDETTVQDDRGHLWGYDTDIEAGTKVTITFDNNHTDAIVYDDKVIDVK